MKHFSRDEPVEVRRTTDANCPWEPAIYIGPSGDKNNPGTTWKQWHDVRVKDQRISVPSRRIRAVVPSR